MPPRIQPEQRRYVVELDPELARRLEAFRIKRAAGRPRIDVIRKAIEQYIARPAKAASGAPAGVTLDTDARRELDRFCDEGDGAVAARVLSNALRMYLPQRRWARQAERQPELLSPALKDELRPALAERAQRVCTRSRVPSRWFLEEALQEQIARSERDQWQQFLYRAPGEVAMELEEVARSSGQEAPSAAASALEWYVKSRLKSEPDLERRWEMLRAEDTAQFTLFQSQNGAVR